MVKLPEESKSKSAIPPAPEVLQTQSNHKALMTSSPSSSSLLPRRRVTYRPSHKATFIGLAVVVLILAANVGVITFIMRGQSTTGVATTQDAVTLNPATLNSLGVSHNTIGNNGAELVVNPNSQFNGTVTVGGDVSVAGQLKLNGKFSASDASFTNLQAGNTSLQQLNVNGDGTATNLNLRKDLTVLGLTRLQGPVTLAQLLTVNNNVNVAGNLAVGGTLSARGFHASSLASDSTLIVGGHVITNGVAPGVGPGTALGSNGTISISGNDASGTVAANIGVGGGNGIIAYVSFRSQYGSTPHVVVTGVGRGMSGLYVNRSASGFSIGVDGAVPPGGYAIDYIVMQ